MKYTIRENSNGQRFVITKGFAVPVDIAALAAGKDAWMRNIECPCKDCGGLYALHELIGGGYCEDCAFADIEE